MRCMLLGLLFAASLAALSNASPGLRAPTWTPEELKSAVEGFCREHDLPKAAKPVRLIDAFMFNSELDMLEVRLLELYDFVDYFVILEGRRSLQDKPKPLHYAENAQRFARFASKIIHVVLDNKPQDRALFGKWQQRVLKEMDGSAALKAKLKRYGDLDEPFLREWWQRDWLWDNMHGGGSLVTWASPRRLEWWQRDWLWKEGVGAHARRGDLIILGDVDEIPRPETLAALRACPFEGKHNCANLDGSFFYYSYSGYAGEWLAGPKVVAYRSEETMGGMDQDGLRFEGNCTLKLPKTSTHCTGCFATIAAFRDKVESFAHWQVNNKHLHDPELILHKVRSGLAMFDPDDERAALHPVAYCNYAPRAVLENPHALHYMLARDAKTGSFSDYDAHFGQGRKRHRRKSKKGSRLALKRTAHGSSATQQEASSVS